MRLTGLEFASHQTLAGVAPIDGSDLDILTSLFEILQRHDKAKRFGVRLLHDPLNLGETALLETCDPVHRVLTSQSEADAPIFAQSIPTGFRWEEARVASGEEFVITQGCMQLCRTVSRCAQPEHGVKPPFNPEPRASGSQERLTGSQVPSQHEGCSRRHDRRKAVIQLCQILRGNTPLPPNKRISAKSPAHRKFEPRQYNIWYDTACSNLPKCRLPFVFLDVWVQSIMGATEKR